MKIFLAFLFLLAVSALCACQALPFPGPGGIAAVPGQAATPAFSPNPAYYYANGNSASITISCSTPSSYICYATSPTVPVPNGSGGCSTGTLYSTALSESSALTLNAACGASGYSNSVTASDVVSLSTLVADWQMSNGSGTTVTDATGAANLTITAGSGSWATLSGVSGGVYNFDGTATHMDAANYNNLNFNYNQSFSVFVVVDFAATASYLTLASRLNTGSNYQGWEFDIGYHSPDYVPEFFLCNTYSSNCLQTYASATYDMSANTLYDVLVTYSGNGSTSGVKFYINGSLTSGNSSVLNSLTNTTTNTIDPRIGARTPTAADYFKQYMGPVRIWNRVLTSTEATTLHGNFYANIN